MPASYGKNVLLTVSQRHNPGQDYSDLRAQGHAIGGRIGYDSPVVPAHRGRKPSTSNPEDYGEDYRGNTYWQAPDVLVADRRRGRALLGLLGDLRLPGGEIKNESAVARVTARCRVLCTVIGSR